MFTPGEVVFFKKARKGTARKHLASSFNGNGFGVFLGHVPPFQKDPTEAHLLRLMGTIGYLTFDDIGEFFGAEVGAECVKKFEDKYWKIKEPEVKTSGLVDVKGNPLENN